MTLQRLSKSLGYRFQDPALLEQALTHRSAGQPHNERLEFLGDAVLNLIIAEELFRRFPSTREGVLTRIRASLVKGETLAAVARQLGLGQYLRLGGGELKSGGRDRGSILADCLEAVFGAVHLDGGYTSSRQVIVGLFEEQLEEAAAGAFQKDPKTRLQEWLQSRQRSLPVYAVESVAGEAHRQRFTVVCELDGPPMKSRGSGSSRRRAEQDAAEKALAQLLHESGHAG